MAGRSRDREPLAIGTFVRYAGTGSGPPYGTYRIVGIQGRGASLAYQVEWLQRDGRIMRSGALAAVVARPTELTEEEAYAWSLAELSR